MPITYVPLFIDMLSDHFEDLTDEEVGQIVRAALLFAAEGVEPEFERRSVLGLTWKRMRAHVIQCMEKSETNKTNGSKGGRPKNQTKPTETEKNPIKPNKTEKNPIKPNKTENNHEQEQEQSQYQYQSQEQKQEQYNAPAPATDDKVIAFDGSDLTQASEDNEQAQRLVARYMPAGRMPVEFDPRVGEISELISKYGLEKVKETMKNAVSSDRLGGLSVNYIKAILENKGGKSRAAPGGDYMRRQYDDDHWKSIEVNLDAM